MSTGPPSMMHVRITSIQDIVCVIHVTALEGRLYIRCKRGMTLGSMGAMEFAELSIKEAAAIFMRFLLPSPTTGVSCIFFLQNAARLVDPRGLCKLFHFFFLSMVFRVFGERANKTHQIRNGLKSLVDILKAWPNNLFKDWIVRQIKTSQLDSCLAGRCTHSLYCVGPFVHGKFVNRFFQLGDNNGRSAEVALSNNLFLLHQTNKFVACGILLADIAEILSRQ
mmetsp:Transcript_26779/g.48639  ORF Transcript_26779/g.48639 Transcript_26779/m.48639 type:complete len:223 (+) Transcript_26779:1376-2044(+)